MITNSELRTQNTEFIMNLSENVKEGLRSIKGNMLRTVLTALIIAIGITALVGILTAIDGLQGSLNSSFAELGANSFDIRSPQQFRRRRGGVTDKKFPPIEYRHAKMYKELFTQKNTNGIVSISTSVSGNAQIKHSSLKTDPNARVKGIDENYLTIKSYKLTQGRNISVTDIQYGTNVAIIGQELVNKLFPKENPIEKEISILGLKFKVIGVLEKKGSGFTGGGDDRVALIPLETGRGLAGNRTLTFDITTYVPNVSNIEFIVGEATSIMRRVRGDEIGEAESFEVERADSVLKDIEENTDRIRIGGLGISILTLLGACIALMNIMLVSVTERTREIGIRKALGATPLKIRLQFLIEAIVICILGGIGGILLGIIIGNVTSKFLTGGEGTFIVPWAWMITGIIVCVFVGILSGIYPAIKASKLDPIEALRYE